MKSQELRAFSHGRPVFIGSVFIVKYPYKYTVIGWVSGRLDPSEREELVEDLLPRVLTMPYVITVSDGPSIFHVVHAELMLTDDEVCDRRLSDMVSAVTWSRRLIHEINAETTDERQTPIGSLVMSGQPWEPGLSLTFAGHTPLSTLVMHRSHLFIDGGAFLRTENTRLHVLEVEAARKWTMSSSLSNAAIL